jgi:hypothetical protein
MFVEMNVCKQFGGVWERVIVIVDRRVGGAGNLVAYTHS